MTHEQLHFTYQTKNLVNGKTYIGVHSTNNLDDGYIGSGKLLKKAIAKYGIEKFNCTTLCFFETAEEAYEEEEYLVNVDWVSCNKNYNLVVGGVGGNKVEWTPEMRTKFSRLRKGQVIPEHVRRATAEANKSRVWTKESKRSVSRLVIDLQTGIYYDSAREAADLLGHTYNTLQDWLRKPNRNKTSLKYAE